MEPKQKKIEKEYQNFINDKLPKPNLLKNCFNAFWTGGLICVVGQFFRSIGIDRLGMNIDDSSGFTSMVMIFIGAFLTGLGVYDQIGKFAGAGSIVPITGFANSIVSPAMEFKREGYVFGVAAKMFTIAGPVLVYGITASVLYGIILILVR
ncbi:MAG: stage V sporulation protein AC [Clostridia bacterium]|nr:stage V sporulation protein AC [Clostridia bacterium]